MSVYLPQEIVELILDQLKDSRSTLLQCSLVSRAWRIRSQYLLFLRLRLAFQTSWDFPDGRNILNNHQPGEKFMGYIYRLEKTLLSNNSIVSNVQELSLCFVPLTCRAAMEELPIKLPFTQLQALRMTYPVILCNTKENIRRVRRLCSFIENNSSLRRITIDHLVLDTQTIQMLIRSSRSLPNLDDLCLNETRLSPSVSSAYEDVGLLRSDLFTSSLKRLCWKPAPSPAETSVTNSGTFLSLAEGFLRNISLFGKTIFPNLEELALVGPNHKWGFDLMSLHATTLKRVSIELDFHCDPLLCPPDVFSRLKRLTHLQLFFSKPCHAVHVLSLLEADAHKLLLQSLRIVLPEHFEDFVYMLDPLLSSIASRLSHSLTEIGLCLGHDLEDGNSNRRVFGWLNLSLFRLLYTSDGLLRYDEPSIWWV